MNTAEVTKSLFALAAQGKLIGAYDDIPIEAYHAGPGISSTRIKALVEASYSLKRMETILADKEGTHFKFGAALHLYESSQKEFHETYSIGKKVLNKITLSPEDMSAIIAMTTKLYKHPEAAPLLIGAKKETTFYTIDKETGLLIKCRTDALPPGLRAVADLKSTKDASKIAFERDCRKFLVRISAAHYLDIVTAVYEQEYKDFWLIPIEKFQPHDVTTYRVKDASIEYARTEIRKALGLLAAAKANPNMWQGYELGLKELSI